MKTIISAFLIIFTSISLPSSRPLVAQNPNLAPVSIRINLKTTIGPMTPVWAWLGYDEPNYTYMKDGKKLLSEFAAASLVPVHVRAHNLLTTGDGTPALKWGSTNAYTEDEHGNPIYNWTIIDKIFNTCIERGMKPLAEIGFMPKALSTHPEPYQHSWRPGAHYTEVFTGWAYPPPMITISGPSWCFNGCGIRWNATVRRKWKVGIGNCGMNPISVTGKVPQRNI